MEGDLFTQSEKTRDLLLTKYMKAAITYEDVLRIERLPVPREALREAILNTLIHRDYTNTAPTQIRVYDDCLCIANPATLPEGWNADTLLQPHNSEPPNPLVAGVFFRAGEIEAWGRGIQRIHEACQQAGAPLPTLRLEAGWLWTEFRFGQDYLDALARRPSTGHMTVENPEVTPEVTPEVRLVIMLDQPMTRRELQEALQLKDAKHFRKAYLLASLEQGLVEMTIPDKPTSRLQKYRLTAKGRALRAKQTGKA